MNPYSGMPAPHCRTIVSMRRAGGPTNDVGAPVRPEGTMTNDRRGFLNGMIAAAGLAGPEELIISNRRGFLKGLFAAAGRAAAPPANAPAQPGGPPGPPILP